MPGDERSTDQNIVVNENQGGACCFGSSAVSCRGRSLVWLDDDPNRRSRGSNPIFHGLAGAIGRTIIDDQRLPSICRIIGFAQMIQRLKQGILSVKGRYDNRSIHGVSCSLSDSQRAASAVVDSQQPELKTLQIGSFIP